MNKPQIEIVQSKEKAKELVSLWADTLRTHAHRGLREVKEDQESKIRKSDVLPRVSIRYVTLYIFNFSLKLLY